LGGSRVAYSHVTVELRLHGSSVDTVFDLLGRNENDMTFALGWGLSRNDAILRRFVERVAVGAALEPPVVVELQEHDRADGGFTDVEILSADLHVIVEAKRGWDPPSESQLRRYEARLSRAGRPVQRVVILTQNGAETVVRHQVGPWQPSWPASIEVLGWSDVVGLIRGAGRGGSLADRRLAAEIATYLRGVADMRNIESNSVYVVSLATSPFPGWTLAPIEIIEKHGRYFFPATGKNWPKTPPNYVAFRYYGRLQSIHHVDEYTIAQDMSPFFSGAPDGSGWDPHFLMTLGPAIRPDHEVRTGKGIVRSARVWVDIDLLLTAKTITEAAEQTRRRHAG
jgi:hypothetical protein